MEQTGFSPFTAIVKWRGRINHQQRSCKINSFDFKPTKDAIQGSPMISQDKPWMKFLDALPKNFGDTTQWIKPQYVRFTPYTPYTRWDEDPVNDPIITNEKELKISMVLNVNSAIKYDVREQRVILTGKITMPFKSA